MSELTEDDIIQAISTDHESDVRQSLVQSAARDGAVQAEFSRPYHRSLDVPDNDSAWFVTETNGGCIIVVAPEQMADEFDGFERVDDSGDR
jgi:hypothetical protein